MKNYGVFSMITAHTKSTINLDDIKQCVNLLILFYLVHRKDGCKPEVISSLCFWAACTSNTEDLSWILGRWERVARR